MASPSALRSRKKPANPVSHDPELRVIKPAARAKAGKGEGNSNDAEARMMERLEEMWTSQLDTRMDTKIQAFATPLLMRDPSARREQMVDNVMERIQGIAPLKHAR